MSGRAEHGREETPGAEAGWTAQPGQERRRQRQCPSCGGASLIRGCRVPGVQLQVVTQGGERRSGLIGLYSDVCVDCGLTCFYARRGEVASQLQQMEAGSGGGSGRGDAGEGNEQG